MKINQPVYVPPQIDPDPDELLRRDWAEANLGGTGGGVPAEVDGGSAGSVYASAQTADGGGAA